MVKTQHFQNTIFSLNPRIVAVSMLFLSILGSNPKGPVPMCRAQTIHVAAIAGESGVLAYGQAEIRGKKLGKFNAGKLKLSPAGVGYA